MDSVLASIVIVPGAVALLLLLVYSYLYRQSRDPFFRSWQRGWAAYCMNFVLLAMYFMVDQHRAWLWGANFCFTLLAWKIYRSTDALRHEARGHAADAVLLAGGAIAATLDTFAARDAGFMLGGLRIPWVPTELWIAIVMVI